MDFLKNAYGKRFYYPNCWQYRITTIKTIKTKNNVSPFIIDDISFFIMHDIDSKQDQCVRHAR